MCSHCEIEFVQTLKVYSLACSRITEPSSYELPQTISVSDRAEVCRLYFEQPLVQIQTLFEYTKI